MPLYLPNSLRGTSSTSNPANTNDTNSGYRVGDQWHNTATGNTFYAVDVTAGAAVWRHIPRTLAMSGANVTAPANDTNENTLATITVPANAMGTNGTIELHTDFSQTNNGNGKTIRVRFSGAAGTILDAAGHASIANRAAHYLIQNENSASVQRVVYAGNNISIYPTSATVDTTAATTIVITAQKATGTDTVTLRTYWAILRLPDIT